MFSAKYENFYHRVMVETICKEENLKILIFGTFSAAFGLEITSLHIPLNTNFIIHTSCYKVMYRYIFSLNKL